MRTRSMWLAALVLAGCGRGNFDTIDPPLAARQNYVFATSSVHTGNLGGLAGADAICQQRADDVDLPGAYIAYLSTTTTTAASRIAGARGWKRPDGKQVADRPDQFTSFRAWYPISTDESGHDVRAITPETWTGTAADGAVLDTCGDWQDGTAALNGSIGTAEAGASRSIDHGTDPCNLPHRLFCFGIDVVQPVPPPDPVVGRVVFVSNSPWRPNQGGITDADLLCQTEAVAARPFGVLAGRVFVAALPSNGMTTADRFSDGGPWVRADGVQLAAYRDDLFGSPFLDAHLTMNASGEVLPPSDDGYWAGDPNDINLDSCASWQTGVGSADYGFGDATAHDRRFKKGNTPCSNPSWRLLCAEN